MNPIEDMNNQLSRIGNTMDLKALYPLHAKLDDIIDHEQELFDVFIDWLHEST